MDDTAILATSREALQTKLNLLFQAANDIGMVVHPFKSKFIVSGADNNEPFQIGNFYVERVQEYLYLGTPISPSPISQQVKSHLSKKKSHMRNFSSFLRKNSEAPFKVKL
jgi:hypothetical protein